MEPRGFGPEARTAEGERFLSCELGSSEALTGLARCSILRGDAATSGELKRGVVTESQEKLMVTQEFNEYTSTRTTGPERLIENTPSKLHGTNCRSNSVTKSRPKATKSEEQARKLGRILANREAARQTIRRRQE